MSSASTAAKPNVLIIGPYPPPFAGPEAAIKMLLESDLNEQFSLIHLKTNMRKKNAEKGKVNFSALLNMFRFYGLLVYLLIRHRPRSAYYFVTATRLGWLGRDVWVILISRLLCVKITIHMRAGHFKHRLKEASRVEKFLIGFACRRAQWCLVQSESLRDQFTGLARDEQIAVVPNMIDVTRFDQVKPNSHTFGKIFFMGHLSVAKGYCEILKSIPDIASEFPDVKFEFAGSKLQGERNVFHNQRTGELLPIEDPEECYNQYIKDKFENNYHYYGPLDESAKIKILEECDFFILPSFSEGFSMAVLEALAMSKPVITTKVGALQDIIHHQKNGELIEPGDTKALIHSLRTLLSDRSYRDRIARENGTYVRKNFTQARVAALLASYLK